MQDSALRAIPVSGSTRLFAVLGDPVAQVRAPALLNPLFARLRTDAVLIPVHVRPKAFSEVVRGLQRMENLDGALITIPHKAAAMAFADDVSPAAQVAGAANALRREPDGRWYAENFDGQGFVSGLVASGHSPAGKRVALMGAGGAGSSIAAALLSAGAAHVSFCDPDESKRRTLSARLEEHWPRRASSTRSPTLEGADIAINATPLGMCVEDPLPFSPHVLRPDCVVADVIMKPRETALLTAAAALGHPIVHGAHMLDHQLDLYRRFFRLDQASSVT